MNIAPIVVFVYNRPNHTIELFESLKECYEVARHDVIVYSDGAKRDVDVEKVNEVRLILNEYCEKKCFNNMTVIQAQKNKGLATSVIEGVSEVIKKYKNVIVLEDDLRFSRDFISYMQNGLTYYGDDERVGAISGYSPIRCINVAKSLTGNSWGWATWLNRWEKVDWTVNDYSEFCDDVIKRKKFDYQQANISEMLDYQMLGKIDSWAVRWDYHFFKNGLWTIYPNESKVLNKGFDGSGTHSGVDKKKRGGLAAKEYCFKSLDELSNITRRTSGNSLMNKLLSYARKFKGFVGNR